MLLYNNYYLCVPILVHKDSDMKQVIQITSREFRANQRKFFDLADKGIQVILRRRNKQAYVLTPIDDDELYLTPEMRAKLDRSIQQAKEGKVKELTPELLKKLLGQ